MIRQLLLGLACTLALASPGMAQEFRRGDVDVDGHLVPIVDAAFLFYWQFSASAPSPQCMDAADANDDGAVNVADSIYLLSLGFIGGPGLPLDPDCSVDSTPDALSCARKVPAVISKTRRDTM